jgi:dTMP kinase
MAGKFVTFEGPDGAGKTTQMKMLGEKLTSEGIAVSYTREPGGTKISEEIRKLLLDPSNKEMVFRTETLLYAAARAQHVEEFIRPEVAAGKFVLCDRFTDSTIAYQGYGRGIDLGFLERLNQMATAGVLPDMTFILDIDPGQGINRIIEKRSVVTGEGKDRIELENINFHNRVRTGFLELAQRDRVRCKVINGANGQAEIHNEIYRLVKEVLAQ